MFIAVPQYSLYGNIPAALVLQSCSTPSHQLRPIYKRVVKFSAMDSHTPFMLVVAFTPSMFNRYIICGNTVRYIGNERDNTRAGAAHTRPQAMEPAGSVVCPIDCSE